MNTLQNRVEKLLTEKGISKAYISRELGIGYSTLWRRLKGERNVNVEFLSELAKVLGTTTSYLMGDVDSPVRSKDESLYHKDTNEIPYWDALLNNVVRVIDNGDTQKIAFVTSLINSARSLLAAAPTNLQDKTTHMNLLASHGNNNQNIINA